MNNIERHNLCKRCLNETEYREEENISGIDLVEAIKLAVEDIDKFLKANKVWENPVNSSKELCDDCPYKLEHLVLGHKDVEETNTECV